MESHIQKHVLIVGLDGLRVDALKAARVPHLDRLIAEGVVTYNAYAGGELGASTEQPTSSGAGWSSILTGVWANKHNVPDNRFYQPNYTQYPHFFTRIKQNRSGVFLSSIVNWKPINAEILSDADFYDSGDDEMVKLKAIHHLQNADPDVLFLHFDQLDIIGEKSGFMAENPEYVSAIERLDQYIGEILQTIENRVTYSSEDWLIMVTTDHGGIGTGHGGHTAEERNILIVASGKGVKKGKITPGPGMVAIPPTVCRHLEIPVDDAWGWESRAFEIADEL